MLGSITITGQLQHAAAKHSSCSLACLEPSRQASEHLSHLPVHAAAFTPAGVPGPSHKLSDCLLVFPAIVMMTVQALTDEFAGMQLTLRMEMRLPDE